MNAAGRPGGKTESTTKDTILRLKTEGSLTEPESTAAIECWLETETLGLNSQERVEQFRKKLGRNLGPKSNQIFTKILDAVRKQQNHHMILLQQTQQQPTTTQTQQQQQVGAGKPVGLESKTAVGSGVGVGVGILQMQHQAQLPQIPVLPQQQPRQQMLYHPQPQFVSQNLNRPLPVPPQAQPPPPPQTNDYINVVTLSDQLVERENSRRIMREGLGGGITEIPQSQSQPQPQTKPAPSTSDARVLFDVEYFDKLVHSVLQPSVEADSLSSPSSLGPTSLSENAKIVLSRGIQTHLQTVLDMLFRSYAKRCNLQTNQIFKFLLPLNQLKSLDPSMPDHVIQQNRMKEQFSQGLALKWGPDAHTLLEREEEININKYRELKKSIEDHMVTEFSQFHNHGNNKPSPYWMFEEEEEQLGILGWEGLARSHLRQDLASKLPFPQYSKKRLRSEPNDSSSATSFPDLQMTTNHIGLKDMCRDRLSYLSSNNQSQLSSDLPSWVSSPIQTRPHPFPLSSDSVIRTSDVLSILGNMHRPHKGGKFNQRFGKAIQRAQMGLPPTPRPTSSVSGTTTTSPIYRQTQVLSLPPPPSGPMTSLPPQNFYFGQANAPIQNPNHTFPPNQGNFPITATSLNPPMGGRPVGPTPTPTPTPTPSLTQMQIQSPQGTQPQQSHQLLNRRI